MALFRNRKRRTEVLERPEYGWIWKPLLTLLILYLVICIGLGLWWSQRPDSFDVDKAVVEWRGMADPSAAPRGLVLSTSLATTVATLLDKPGGLLRNDVAPPGLWLDNMPSWEYGVLHQARLAVSGLSTMVESTPESLADAEDALDSDSRDWLYPSAEKRYANAVDALEDFMNRIATGETVLANDGQALAVWLRTVADRFDELTRQLSASIDDPEALRELGVNEAELPESTPWYRIDNVFYEARGEAWALMHYLRAVRRDYADVLAKAEVEAGLERMIAELEMTQRRLWSPVVLNGSGFGIFANHSLVLANYTMEVRDQAQRLANNVESVQVEARSSSLQPAHEPEGQPQEPVESLPQDDTVAPSLPDEGNSETAQSGDDITPPQPAEAAPEAPTAPQVTPEEAH